MPIKNIAWTLACLLVLSCDDGAKTATDTTSAPDTSADVADTSSPPDDISEDTLFPKPLTALLPLDGQMLYPVQVDRQLAWMVVDTGAVRTAVQETLLREVKNGVGIADFDFDHDIILADYQVIAADLSEAINHIGVALGGLIGQDLFLKYYFALDYRNRHVFMANTTPEGAPPGFALTDRVEWPYDLIQGLPIVTVEIDGQPLRLIADTGSGVTLVTRSKVPESLLQNGLDGYVWYTSYGSDPATIIRLPEMLLGTLPVRNAWVVVVPDDFHLRSVFEMIGVQVDGFLGFPAYRHFTIGIRGYDSAYDLYPYTDLSHIADDEWDRVGIEVMNKDGQVEVTMVFSPSDAATKGVMPGDILETIDGEPAATLPLDTLRLQLRGEVGSTRQLGLRRGEQTISLSVLVEELLP